MKKFISILIFCFIMMTSTLLATENVVLLKNAPDYKIFYDGDNIAVVSNLKKDEALTRNVIINNELIERYQVYLPIYIQIDYDETINKANLVRGGQNISTEKELTVKKVDNRLEVVLEQVVGMPDGVGMIAETINQDQRIYHYQIDWLANGFAKKSNSLDVVVVREYEAEKYDYIYENMINKNYTNIYSMVMGMNNTELSVAETYLAAKYGVNWDVDAKMMEEMRELNVAKINFSDLSVEHWAYDVIKNMAVKGVLTGYEDGTFRPENNITRAEVAQILTKFFNLDALNNDQILDLSDGHWAYNAIKRASLFIPMKGNKFEPELNITRKDFIVAIMNIKDVDIKAEENAFSDIGELEENEILKINAAQALGIIKGYGDGTFGPEKFITRAEACAILTRSK